VNFSAGKRAGSPIVQQGPHAAERGTAKGNRGLPRRKEQISRVAINDLDFEKMRDVDNKRTIQPHKDALREALFPLIQIAVDQEFLAIAQRDGGIISLGLYANDLAYGDHPHGPMVLEEHRIIGLQRLLAARLRTRATEDMVERRGQPVGEDRLQKVVDGIDLEGAHGEFLMSRDEDDSRHGAELGKQIESGGPGHLDIQKQKVSPEFFAQLGSFSGTRGLPDDFDLWMGRKKVPQVFARRSLVVNNQRTPRHIGRWPRLERASFAAITGSSRVISATTQSPLGPMSK